MIHIFFHKFVSGAESFVACLDEDGMTLSDFLWKRVKDEPFAMDFSSRVTHFLETYRDGISESTRANLCNAMKKLIKFFKEDPFPLGSEVPNPGSPTYGRYIVWLQDMDKALKITDLVSKDANKLKNQEARANRKVIQYYFL